MRDEEDTSVKNRNNLDLQNYLLNMPFKFCRLYFFVKLLPSEDTGRNLESDQYTSVLGYPGVYNPTVLVYTHRAQSLPGSG